MARLEQLKNELSEKNAKRLNIHLFERLIKRLESFAENCTECKDYIKAVNVHIDNLINKQNQIEIQDSKAHRQLVSRIISHLQKEHKLVTEGQYAGAYMSMGISVGLVFGLLIFDNLAIWLAVGLSIGLAIGSGKDADALKKGLTI